MKQFYILALAGLMSFGAAAQKACAPAEAVRTELRDVKAAAPALDGDRETIWATTFANCDEWAFDNKTSLASSWIGSADLAWRQADLQRLMPSTPPQRTTGS